MRQTYEFAIRYGFFGFHNYFYNAMHIV